MGNTENIENSMQSIRQDTYQTTKLAHPQTHCYSLTDDVILRGFCKGKHEIIA